MDGSSFDAWTRRRFALTTSGAVFTLFGLARLDTTTAKKKGKNRGASNHCRANGERCGKRGKGCRTAFCLSAPFTITVVWTELADHDTYIFVPKVTATSAVFPFIDCTCNPGNSACDVEYPFACVDEDVETSGDEITTVHRLLKGPYEYWLALDPDTLAGELTVVLRDKDGRIVRQWSNPANPEDNQRGWHVFDINGRTRSVRSIDVLIGDSLPDGAHANNQDVCPR